MLRGAITGGLFFCVLFGCASSNVGKIDRQIQKNEYKKSIHHEEMVKFIYQIDGGDTIRDVKQLLKEKKFEFKEQEETLTRVDGKALGIVKKIYFWDTVFPDDRYTLLFQCEDETNETLKAAYFGVSEIRIFTN